MIRVAVAGAAGRMGRRIINVINETAGVELAGAVDTPLSPLIGQDSGETAGIGKNGVPITDDVREAMAGADILIDFTNPSATMANLAAAADTGKGIVIGTTGLSKEEKEKLAGIAKSTKVVFTPNMSVGINVLLSILPKVAKMLGDDYDIEIIEAHHRMKKDAPSGTALRLAEAVAEGVNRNLDEVGVYARKGIIGERGKKEIGLQTIRAGDIVGDHTVLFGGMGERIEITHKASSRDCFARGAVRAAVWLADKKPGLYDMRDVLGIEKRA